MTTHTDEPQPPREWGTNGTWTYGDGPAMTEDEAFAQYHVAWRVWARAELTAARTRIAEVEGELERVRGLVRHAYREGYEEAEYHDKMGILHSGRMEESWLQSDFPVALAAALATTDTDSTGGETT